MILCRGSLLCCDNWGIDLDECRHNCKQLNVLQSVAIDGLILLHTYVYVCSSRSIR